MAGDIIIGIDAGTSVIKSIAFDLGGRQIASAAKPNRYATRPDGAATQPMSQTWEDVAETLRGLGDKIPDLGGRAAALAVTAQGDGTWLVGAGNAPCHDGWLWLDARAAPVVKRLRGTDGDQMRFRATGTGLNSCQMGPQLAHMQETDPDVLGRAEVALHCKDWIYLNLTGIRATDPSEGVFTFGDFRDRRYKDEIVEMLGLSTLRHLLPEIVDGSQITHPLTAQAAAQTGLPQGLPVSLGFVDVTCTALGAGVYTQGTAAGVTILGSTGMHMRSCSPDQVFLNADLTGYVMVLPIPGIVAQMQSNMAATLNIDWWLSVAADLLSDLGQPADAKSLIARVDEWVAGAAPGQVLYHPYISDAGERGPFVDNAARAAFLGLNASHRFPDMLRGVIEGLGMAARDCYAAMGHLPGEVRLTGGAARSQVLRGILGAAVEAPVCVSDRDEAGAAGAAMMAAVAIGAYGDMNACIADWVTPLLGAAEVPDPDLTALYRDQFAAYVATRQAMQPQWERLAQKGAANA